MHRAQEWVWERERGWEGLRGVCAAPWHLQSPAGAGHGWQTMNVGVTRVIRGLVIPMRWTKYWIWIRNISGPKGMPSASIRSLEKTVSEGLSKQTCTQDESLKRTNPLRIWSGRVGVKEWGDSQNGYWGEQWSGWRLTLLHENGSHQILLSRMTGMGSVIRKTIKQPYAGWNRSGELRGTSRTFPWKVWGSGNLV